MMCFLPFIDSQQKDVGCYVLEYTSEEHLGIRAQALGTVSFLKIAFHLANKKQKFSSGGPGFSPVDKVFVLMASFCL